MNHSQRKRLSEIAIDLLKEVAEDVLLEAQGNGENGLSPVSVGQRMEINPPYEGGLREGSITREILKWMQHEGRAVNDNPRGRGRPGSWRLAD